MINTDITSPDANSYATEVDLTAFSALRGIDLPDSLVPLLIKAMDYLEGLDWVGSKADSRQPLAWPRVNVVLDEHDFPSDEVPRQVITAQCMLAVEAIDGDLLSSVREAAVKTERVEGAVTITYVVADGEVFIPAYPAVMALLGDLAGGRGYAINAFAERA
ncbi:DnaT-like ssDNA-binding protein [Citrobacter europaeus]|uniref:DnaT-like ssDNA-binding protein n=1 Tax=Citrobacter europaeus TaxID=1914243 RepID=UPI001BCB18F6|nr:DnaT-like ssDNA-binding protein [Citrobacter europaeus]